MHAGGGGGFHGGGYAGGFRGGYSGGYAGRGSYGPRGDYGAGRSSVAGHPWSWEGHSSGDNSPGWHQFASRNTSNVAHSGAATSASRSMSSSSPSSRQAGTGAMHHAPIADGQWHSFAGQSSEVAHATPASVSRAGLVSAGVAWRGNFGGAWRAGWGWGWPGWNWGWGWGCCGWSWGFGFGWGWGAWAPIWAWPPYWYGPWLGATPAPPYVLDPYPA